MRTRPPVLVTIAILVGAGLVIGLGLLTFGVTATVGPRGLPLAVAVPDGAAAPLQQAAQRVVEQGGEQVSWRLTSPAEARRLLDEKAVYGVLELASGAPATVVLSGAVNPNAAQAAQQVLAPAAQAASAGTGQPVTQTVHPASAPERTAPLAAATLLWAGTLGGTALLVALGSGPGRRTTVALRLAVAIGVTVAATAVVLALMALWDWSLLDRGLRVDSRLIGFLLLTGLGFAAVQGAVLRLLGMTGMSIFGPLYLMAPVVAGQVPELMHPAYRVLLWSWTPIRFPAEGLRSLLLLDSAPDLRTAVWVVAGMAVVGMVGLLWPSRRQPAPDGAASAGDTGDTGDTGDAAGADGAAAGKAVPVAASAA